MVDFELRNNYMELRAQLEECSNNMDVKKLVWIKVWAEYLCSVFNCDVALLYMHPQEFLGRLFEISEWLNSRQPYITSLVIEASTINTRELSFFLNSLRMKSSAYISLCPNFDIAPLEHTFETDYLTINGAGLVNWIRMDRILSYNCIHIVLGCFVFTETDINRFLKAWVKGSNPRLVYFHVKIKKMNHELVVDGLDVVEKDASVIRTYNHDRLFSNRVKLQGGTDIKNEKGVLATFKQEEVTYPSDPNQIADFNMVVWG